MTGPLFTEDELCHVYQVLSGDLQLCGCGYPEAAYALVSRTLNWAADSTADGAIPPAELTAGGEGASHIILSALDGAGLMEHGMTMTYPWLTPKGRAVRSLLARVTDPCTDACWLRWDPQHVPD